MRTETTYIALDETEFDTEEECLEYERVFNERLSFVRFFDEHFTEQKNLDDIGYYTEIMYIRDAEQADKLFDQLNEYNGFEKPEFAVEDGDVLQYDEEWISLRSKLAEIENTIKTIEERVKQG